MRSASFIIKFSSLSCLVFLLCGLTVAQKVALLTPDATKQSELFAERLSQHFGEYVNVLDMDLSQSAYHAVSPSSPFNLTAAKSKLIGAAIGCDFFVLIRSSTQRRSAFRREEYYEAYAHIFVVSSRTGQLVFWKNEKIEATKADAATKLLDISVEELAKEIASKLKTTQYNERNAVPVPLIEEIPDADSPLSKDFKAPIPYRRIKPGYTTEAAIYGVTATVEIFVDTDASGAITRTDFVRWAGFGLEESVEKAVRAMSWRPAFRGGKPLPMRFLLRYNFKKIEKEE